MKGRLALELNINEIVQGRLKEDKQIYAFFLDVQKHMWRDGLWLNLWDVGVKVRMWRVIKKMHEASVQCFKREKNQLCLG